MKEPVSRRIFLATAGTAALAASATTALAAEAPGQNVVKILGVSCSPRQGMTTARAVQAALDAAKAVEARVQTELIDLGGLNIAGCSPTIPEDDFDAVLPKLKDPQLGGLIIASPSYFRSLSSLCKAFIERCMPLREPKMVLANKPVGALALGGNAPAMLGGALAGAVMAISLITGRNTSSESREENHRRIRRLIREFEARFRAVQCRDLIGCRFDTAEGQRQFIENNLRARCAEFTREAARRVGGRLSDA